MEQTLTPTTCWSTEAFRRHGELVLRLLSDFVETSRRGDGKVARLEDVGALIRSLGIEDLIAEGGVSDAQFEKLVRGFLDGATRLQHPGYMAHQIALPHYGAALADLIAGVLNNGMSVYEMGPTAGAIEVAMIDWMLSKVGWQPTGRDPDRPPAPGAAGGGVLTNGGSLANLTALLAARAAIAPEAWERGTPSDLVLLASGSAHYSVARAAAILGLGTQALVKVPCDAFGRLLPEALPAVVERVGAEGRRVLAVCANACATATGLYDPLAEVGAFCRERGLWFHVDGAHGASVLIHPTESRRLAGVELADSLVWDAHKLLQTSALCTAVLFRDGATLGRAFRQDAVYVTEGHRETGVDFIEQQFECTKTPLGLKLLLTLAFVGEAGMAANIEAVFGLAGRVHDQISRREGFETLCPPESNILCFRYAGDDAIQSRIRQELMRRGDFLVTQADVAGRRWLRLTLMNPLTDEATIDRLLETIESLGRDLERDRAPAGSA
ncbi:MAG: diaminobutyrate decarboxylase [Holophagales bacterium]|nr:diaminobutyrate decarboxylase [Holophagales bacterium]